MLRTLNNRNKAGRLLKKLSLPLNFVLASFFRQDVGSGFNQWAEDARDKTFLIPDWRIGKGEVYFFRISVPLHDKHDVSHMYRFTGIGPINQWNKVIMDFWPYLKKWLAYA
jgi:hypothetical protein